MKSSLRKAALALAAAGSAAACSANQPDDTAIRSGESAATTMNAVRIVSHGDPGDPGVMRVEQVPRPAVGRGELLVRVHAAAVNPVDTQIRAEPSGFASLPYIPGFDVSGVVTEVGDSVTGLAIGDPVFALLDLERGGGYAEYVVVKASEVALKPTRAPHAEAASLPLVALTAWQALFDTADLEPGQTVLIHAGAGGVGTSAVQLAKWRGARVIATASERNQEFLRSLGVDVVIDYRNERFEDIARDVDVVLDPIGGATQVRSLGTLREGGILVSLVGLTREARSPARNVRATSILVHPDADQLARIADLVDSGDLQPIVTHRFTLDEVAAAHRQSETGSTRGKIVLEVRGESLP